MTEQNNKVESTSDSSGQGRRAFPLKALGILLAVVLIEGAAISTAFVLSGRPAAVSASQGAEKDEELSLDKPIEELVVSDRFQNTRTGRTYLYDTEIYIVVRKRHHERVKQAMEARKAQIRQDIRTIISRAEPSQLLEPTLATLTRQIQAVLDDRIGHDTEEGQSLVEQVLITKCTQFRVDM